jgi:small-conductance mechanosensitive channel
MLMLIPQRFQDIFNYLPKLFRFTLFEINQTPITLISVFMFAFVLAGFLLASLVLNRWVFRKFLASFHIAESLQFTILRISHYLILVVGIVFALQFVGIDLGGLAVIFGLLSVGIGFGLQNIASNFVSGIILLFERPIIIGDRVTVGDLEGDVIAIKMRATTIQTLDNISIIVPNSEFISGKVVNWSHGDKTIRLEIDVGVSYGSDIDLVFKALKEVALEDSHVLKAPQPDILFRKFGDSSLNMTLRVWIDDLRLHYNIRSDLNCAIVRKFRGYGIEIPFPQRDLHMRSPLPVPYTEKEPIDS